MTDVLALPPSTTLPLRASTALAEGPHTGAVWLLTVEKRASMFAWLGSESCTMDKVYIADTLAEDAAIAAWAKPLCSANTLG